MPSDTEKQVEGFIEEVGLSLREIVAKTNNSQPKIAKKSGKKQAYICVALSGKQNLTLSTLAEISLACGMRPIISFKSLRGGR